MRAEFYPGHKGQLFRLVRTPENICGHLLFISPLFEQANNTRHMVTKAATASYANGYQSIVFDHFGTGDSEGQLLDTSLSVWQQDIVEQLVELKKTSDKPIILSLCLSAALLLNDDILTLIDSAQLWQPELNGKRFVKQFKRLMLANEINKTPEIKKDSTNTWVEIAGYTMANSLLDSIAKQTLANLPICQADVEWIEWLASNTQLPPSRERQLTSLQQVCVNKIQLTTLSDEKYWLASELIVSQQLLDYIRNSFTMNSQCGVSHD